MNGKWRVSCLFLFSFLFVAACQPQVPQALGTLEQDRVALTATANEIITELAVPVGAKVKQGDVLVRLDNRLQLAQVNKAEADVALAQANLIKLQNGARPEAVAQAQAAVESAQATLTDAQQTYTRIKDLVAQKLASQANFDRAQTALNVATANVDKAREQLRELTNGTRPEDLQIAAAQVKAAQAVLSSQQQLLAQLTVTATRDGVVDNFPWNQGERVTMGSPVVIMLAGTAPYARVYIPEPYRAKIAVGDALTVHIDGLDKPIIGKVRQLADEPAFTPYYALNEHDRSRLMFLAEVQLPDSFQQQAIGLPVQVQLP